MDSYIGTKLIQATPEYKVTTDYGMGGIETTFTAEMPLSNNGDIEVQEGYKVVYQDGYTSWSPKNVFEKSHLKVDENTDLASKVSIGQQMVDDFIVDYDIFTKKDKITIVIATLKNGFTIVESSACVDHKNYDEKIGAEICKERIKKQVWNHLGFLLQTAYKGVK